MPARVELDNASAVTDVPSESEFQDWVQSATAERAADVNSLVHVRLVDERESAELNLRYRNLDKPTNVLSFPFGEEVEDHCLLLGDLVICAPVIAREAAAQGKPVKHHWAHITVHGTLHLLGHDHIEEKEANIMEAREREILSRFAIPDPYQDEPGLATEVTR